MLNLRQVTERPGQSVDIPPQSTIQFTSGTFVGNMGQSLSFEETNIDDVDVICECEHPATGNQGDGFQASGNAAEPYPKDAIEGITPVSTVPHGPTSHFTKFFSHHHPT